MKSRPIASCRLFAVIAFMSALCGPVSGQTTSASSPLPVNASTYPNSTIVLSPADISRFDVVLPAIVHQAHVALVCEAQPFQLTLTKTASDRLAQQLPASGLPLETAVQRVAAAFDYNAIRTGPNIFLLTKRYTQADDLPDVSFSELDNALQGLMKAESHFVPSESGSLALRDMMRSLPDELRNPLAQGVTISSLPDAQNQMAWQFACGLEFHPLSNIGKVAQRLHACRNAKAMFTYGHYLNLTLPTYQGPFAQNGAIDSVFLSVWINTQSGGGTTLDEGPGVNTVGQKIIIQQGVTDPTTPRLPGQIPVPAVSVLRFSLAAVAIQINSHVPAGGTELPSQVDPALADKTVSLAGSEYLSPSALWKSIADMYGLEVRNEGQAMVMRSPTPRVLTDPAEIGPEMQRLLPMPFLRKVHGISSQNPQEIYVVPSSSLGNFAGSQTQGAEGEIFSVLRASSLYVASVQRLREIIEPQVKKSPGEKLPMADSGDEALKLVALSSLATCIIDFQKLAQPLPSYIMNFNDAEITLSPNSSNPNDISFSVVYHSPDGKGSGIAGDTTFPAGTFR